MYFFDERNEEENLKVIYVNFYEEIDESQVDFKINDTNLSFLWRYDSANF